LGARGSSTSTQNRCVDVVGSRGMHVGRSVNAGSWRARAGLRVSGCRMWTS
jgi:hypothetical protein